MATTSPKSILIFFTGIAISLIVFCLDIFTKYEIADSGCYVAVVLLTILTDKKEYVIITAILTSLLTILGLFFTPYQNFPDELGLHMLTFLSIGFITYIIMKYKDVETLIKKQNKDLELLSLNLKESNKELENFAYISSHDLQEPLRKIQAFGDRLTMSDGELFSIKGKEYLTRMLNAAGRMQQLIDDLLFFSRQTSTVSEFSSIDLNTVLAEVLSDMEILIENTKAEIVTETLPSIDAEPTQMRQLFQNLLSNAIKFRKENTTPLIKIYTKINIPQSHFESQMLEIYIEDNGIGFDEKYNDRIYNIFQKLEGKKYEGSGIGLSICKKIIMRHGGTIYAKSNFDIGTTFIASLPIKQTTIRSTNN